MKKFLLAISLLASAGLISAKTASIDIPRYSEVLPGYTPEVVEERLAASPLHAVEGLWRFPGEGSILAIERPATRRPLGERQDIYLMVAVAPVDRAVRPGTVMGVLAATAKKDVYDCRLYTSSTDDGRLLTSPKKFLLQLADDNRIVFKPYGKKLKIRWWKLFPYMFRRVFTQEGTIPDDLDGCVRVFPEPLPPIEPRYL